MDPILTETNHLSKKIKRNTYSRFALMAKFDEDKPADIYRPDDYMDKSYKFLNEPVVRTIW